MIKSTEKQVLKRPWIKRVLITALVAEVTYVILFNLALQLPLTQTLINQIRPDKFHISWESAWTWYPFRFHVHNSSGNGQSRSQQWEFEAQSVSASIDVLPLIFKRVWIDRVQVSDAAYYQRPRLKPDRDYSDSIQYFPPISGREITNAVTMPRKQKRAWHVEIEDIRLDGQYRYWIHQFKGQARGILEADIDVVSRGGLFSMRVAGMELELGPHTINESRELFRRGVIEGELGFEPFIPRENKGISMLQYTLIDADVDINTNSLAFIDLFTRKFKDLKIDGTGLVNGHLRMNEGTVLDGTDLSIDAGDLTVSLFSHNIKGDGAIRIKVDPETADELALDVRFNDMLVEQAVGNVPLLTGQGLVLIGTSGNDLLRIEGDIETTKHVDFKKKIEKVELRLVIPTAGVTDMFVFNYYIPPGSPLMFTSGTADLEADILLKHDEAGGFLKLRARETEALVSEQMIRGNFSADIAIVDGKLGELQFDITGSEFRLDNITVIGENESFNQRDWGAIFILTQADMTLSDPFRLTADADLSMTDSRPVVAMLGNQKDRAEWIKNMLTVEGISGSIEMDFANRKLVIPHAFLDSDNIEIGARGVIDKVLQDGVIYARYKKLDIVMKVTSGKKNIDIVRARDKFDEYQLPGEFQ